MIFLTNIQKTPLYLAVVNKSIEIVRLLLQNPNIDVNIHKILNVHLFYDIINRIIEWNN